MQRASVSVGSNIAEGAARNSKREFYHFLGISKGSASELQFQIELSFRKKYISETDKLQVLDNIDAIMRMNFNLQQSLQKNRDRSNRNKPD
jgi:four helix bundle protein